MTSGNRKTRRQRTITGGTPRQPRPPADEDVYIDSEPPPLGSHYHWILWAYSDTMADPNNPASGPIYMDYVTVDISDPSRLNAMRRVATLVPNRKYRVHQVLEHFDRNPCNV